MTNNVRDGRYYLTGPQRRVLALMADGWMACWTDPPDSSAFVQQGRVGYGGKWENIRRDTLRALVDRGLVELVGQNHRASHYAISPGGRKAVEEGWTSTRKAR